MYALAQTPTATFWVSPGVYPGASSYTVWRESTNYFAKDATGQIDYSGTNASDVINNALANGVAVFLTDGEYIITHSINLNAGNELLGEGYDTVLKADDNCHISSAMGVIQNIGRPTEQGNDNIRIANLRVDGNNASNAVNYEGIAISHSIGVTIENVWVHNAPEIGISLNGGIGPMTSRVFVINAEVYLNEADGLQIDFGSTGGTGGVIDIIGGRYYNNTNDGIKFSSGIAYNEPPIGELSVFGAEVDHNGNGGITVLYTASRVKNVLLSSNFVHENTNDGITLSGSTSPFAYGSIYGNTIQNNGWCGIKLFVVNGTTVENNLIINNVQTAGGGGNYEAGILVYQSTNVLLSGNIITDDQSPRTQRFGIRLSGGATTSENLTACNNVVTNNKEGAMFFEGTINTLDVRGNIGFVTENCSSASVATGGTVTHFLAGTPTTVLVTAGASGPTDVYVSAVGASTFAINFGGGGTKLFYWCAEYAP